MDEIILGFVFDDENDEKLAAHGLRPLQLEQVLDNTFAVIRNRKNRRAPILIIGRDDGGACIAIPAEPYDGDYWRPVTAWYCKGPEELALRRVQNNG